MKKMLTGASFKNVTEIELAHLLTISGVSVDNTSLGGGFYNVSVGYTPAKLNLEAKEELLRFIGDSILSHHQ
jgi:hypothetical protein